MVRYYYNLTYLQTLSTITIEMSSPQHAENSKTNTPISDSSVKMFSYDIEAVNSKFPDLAHSAGDKIVQISITYRQKDGSNKTWIGSMDEVTNNKNSELLSPTNVILKTCKSENELLSKFIQEIKLLAKLEKSLTIASP